MLHDLEEEIDQIPGCHEWSLLMQLMTRSDESEESEVPIEKEPGRTHGEPWLLTWPRHKVRGSKAPQWRDCSRALSPTHEGHVECWH